MDIYKKFVNKIEERYNRVSNFAKEIEMSKQLFFYHLNNLKVGKVTFNTMQMNLICKKLNVDANFFYNLSLPEGKR